MNGSLEKKMKVLISKLTVMSRRRGGETLKFGIKKLHKGEFPSVKSRKERPEGGGEFQSHFPANIFSKSHFPVLKSHSGHG